MQAGSGPSGLVLALTLAQNGVPVRIIEKDIQFHNGTRGPAVQVRSPPYNFHFVFLILQNMTATHARSRALPWHPPRH